MNSAFLSSLEFRIARRRHESATETAAEVIIHRSWIITLNFLCRSKIHSKNLFNENIKYAEVQK
jgi:hypothetical protein